MDRNNIFFSPTGNSTEYCSEQSTLFNHPEIVKRATACCDDVDYCNEKLNLTLNLPPG